MTFTQPEQQVRTGARRVRVAPAAAMKAAAIIAALGIALIVTMGPSPASAYATVVRDCGDHYVVVRYNADGSVKGVHNKQLSDEGTIYTAGETWKLVEGNPDRFVSEGGAQLQVVACDAALGGGAGVRQTIAIPPRVPTSPVDPGVDCGAADSYGVYVHTGYYGRNLDEGPICEYRPRTPGWGEEVCSSGTPTWQDAGYGLNDIDFTGNYTSSGQPICSNEDGLHSSHKYIQEQQLKQLCIREPTHDLCN